MTGIKDVMGGSIKVLIKKAIWWQIIESNIRLISCQINQNDYCQNTYVYVMEEYEPPNVSLPVSFYLFKVFSFIRKVLEETQDMWVLQAYITIWQTKLLQNHSGCCIIFSISYTASQPLNSFIIH